MPPVSRAGSGAYWKTWVPQRQLMWVAPGGLLWPTGMPWLRPHAGQFLNISATVIPRADGLRYVKVAWAAPVAEQYPPAVTPVRVVRPLT